MQRATAPARTLDRMHSRIVTFAPTPHEIASVPLPAKAETNVGLIGTGKTAAIAVGLAEETLAVLRPAAQ